MKRQAGANAGRAAETQREVEPLAEQHHQIGLRQYFGHRAQCRIVHAARAFHGKHRHAGRARQERRAARVHAARQAWVRR